ncbi:uncharacterized protein BO97DRAFT_237988 [Aspergillus homomorphus CBS 101889]|uniref:Uncharacterized protein n=1 Tax=Aspergillus homomorphus (strain CBS 101889) TaxID=1450537 RepID=A0A395I5K1_ASPHC|nr:hypothetical protein BO97DRAFT_237988 [Aspergillus homomorphus CBS 101889]RAL15065.1 hypothetical protein BO97DRAFT_237988 [Aspergillus homomorphus CBS 101889]
MELYFGRTRTMPIPPNSHVGPAFKIHSKLSGQELRRVTFDGEPADQMTQLSTDNRSVPNRAIPCFCLFLFLFLIFFLFFFFFFLLALDHTTQVARPYLACRTEYSMHIIRH